MLFLHEYIILFIYLFIRLFSNLFIFLKPAEHSFLTKINLPNI